MLLAMGIWGESRGLPDAGKLAVGCVVANRVKDGRFGDGYKGVILKPWQFSSFNHSDPNHGKLLHPLLHDAQPVWESCYRAAETILSGDYVDFTMGALYYFSHPITAPPKAWGHVVWTATIEGLQLYKEAA